MKNKIISLPPNYFYIAIALIILVYFLLPEGKLIKSPHNLTGILFMIFGFYLIGKSYSLFKKNKTPEDYSKSKALVTEGLYKFSRNPMYLGAVIFLIGLVILTRNVLGFIFVILFFLIIDLMFIPYEEEKMEKTFGKKFIKYKKKVAKWI